MKRIMKNNTKVLTLISAFCLTFAAAHGEDKKPEVRKPLPLKYENSTLARGAKKKVLKALKLEIDPNPDIRIPKAAVILKGKGPKGGDCVEFTFSKEDPRPFKRGVRGGYNMTMHFGLNKEDYSEYNRVSAWVYPVQTTEAGVNSINFQLDNVNLPPKGHRKRGLYALKEMTFKPNEWNHITWEIPHLNRDEVYALYIGGTLKPSYMLREMDAKLLIADVQFQTVETDSYEGWTVDKNRISFSHIGYKPNLEKTAIGNDLPAKEFELIDVKSGKTVLKKAITKKKMRLGEFDILDFSEYCQPGEYKLKAGEAETRSFKIAENIWQDTILDALNYFYCQRIGVAIPGVQPYYRFCDLTGFRPDKRHVLRNIVGGWHDAGDISQIHPSNLTYQLFEQVERLDKRNEQNTDFYKRVLEEANVGIDYLLKTFHGDGYRNNIVMCGGFTDGVPGEGTEDHGGWKFGAVNMPADNFKCAAAEALAYRVIKDGGKRTLVLETAKKDWEYAVAKEKEWMEKYDGPHPWGRAWKMSGPINTASWAVISSIELFKATGDKKYADKAIEYGKRVLMLQEQSLLLDLPITGYFYNNPVKKVISHYYHNGGEHTPILALHNLAETFQNDPQWIDWYSALLIHSEYFLKQSKLSAPYQLLPAGVYQMNEAEYHNPAEKAEYLRQIPHGMKVGNDAYLRFLPPFGSWKNGGNDVAVCAGLALSASSSTRGDFEGEELAQRQLQWLLGRNPFSKSLAYGVGYNYESDFGFSKGSFVGGFTVGMDSHDNDEPYWVNSTYFTAKEHWIQPTSHFMWTAAYLSAPAKINGNVVASVKQITFKPVSGGKAVTVTPENGAYTVTVATGKYVIEFGGQKRTFTAVSGRNYVLHLDPQNFIDYSLSSTRDGNRITITLTGQGSRRHNFELRPYNLKLVGEAKQSVTLDPGKKQELKWVGDVIDANKPWVAVAIADGDAQTKKDIFGQIKIP